MCIEQMIEKLNEVKKNMSDPTLPVRSIDALNETVEYVNGVQYSLRTGQRIL